MARLSARDRLESLATAATQTFGRLGYRGTRTADVAAAAGMSAGSVFTYVESKEALFHLVFLHGLGLLPEQPPDLPLAAPKPGETLALFERGLRNMPLPRLRAALAGEEPADAAQELRGVVGEIYDLLERYWPLFAVVERCAPELPELDALWFGGAGSGGVHGAMGRYLERRMATGRLRQMPDAMIAARVVDESVAWFAWHRREGRDSGNFDDQAARRNVIEFACAALLPHPAPAGAEPSSKPLAGRRTLVATAQARQVMSQTPG